MASNFEAFESDVARGRFIATANELHGMFPHLLSPPPLSSLLPPSHTQKRQGTFLLQDYFQRGNLFYITCFFMNSEKSPPGKITVITTVLY